MSRGRRLAAFARGGRKFFDVGAQSDARKPLRRRGCHALGNGGESGLEVGDDGLPRLNSRLAGAINTIAGRSANAIIAAEASKTSHNTERTAKATEEIAKKMGGSNTPQRPMAKPMTVSAGRFA